MKLPSSQFTVTVPKTGSSDDESFCIDDLIYFEDHYDKTALVKGKILIDLSYDTEEEYNPDEIHYLVIGVNEAGDPDYDEEDSGDYAGLPCPPFCGQKHPCDLGEMSYREFKASTAMVKTIDKASKWIEKKALKIALSIKRI